MIFDWTRKKEKWSRKCRWKTLENGKITLLLVWSDKLRCYLSVRTFFYSFFPSFVAVNFGTLTGVQLRHQNLKKTFRFFLFHLTDNRNIQFTLAIYIWKPLSLISSKTVAISKSINPFFWIQAGLADHLMHQKGAQQRFNSFIHS